MRLFNIIQRHKVAAFLSLAIIATVLLMPLGLKLGLQYGLSQFLSHNTPYRVDIKNVTYNPFLSTLTLNDLTIYQQSVLPVASVGHLSIQVTLLALIKDTLKLDALSLEDTHLSIEFLKAPEIAFLGLTLPLQTTPHAPPKKTSFAYRIDVDNIEFKDVNLKLTANKSTVTYQIHQLKLHKENDYYRFILKSQLNHAKLDTNLQLHAFIKQPKILGTVHIAPLNLADLTPLATVVIPKQAHLLNGVISSNLTFTLAQSKKGLRYYQQGDFSLKNGRIKQPNIHVNLPQLSWAGSLQFFNESIPKLHAEGLLKTTEVTILMPEQALKLTHSLTANLNLNASLGRSAPHIIQNGKIVISDMLMTLSEKSAAIKQLKWQGKLSLAHAQTTFIQAAGQLSAQGVNIQDKFQERFQDKHQDKAQSTRLQQDVLANLDLQVALAPTETTILQTGSIRLTNLIASQAQITLNTQQAIWKGQVNVTLPKPTQTQTQTTLTNAPLLSLTSTGQIDVNNLKLSNHKTHVSLVQFSALALRELNLSQIHNITLKQLNIKGLAIAKPAHLKQPGLVKVAQVSLDKAHLQQLNSLTLGNLTIKDIEAHITVNKSGKIDALQTLLSAFPRSQTALTYSDGIASIGNKTENTGLQYALNSVKLRGKNQVDLTTFQAEPPLSKRLNLTTFSLGAIDSQHPTQNTAFTLNLTIDEFSQLHSSGQIQPLNPKLNLKAKTELQGLSLIDLTRFSEQFIGYKINSGQLTLELDTEIVDNQIHADNHLHLHKFELIETDKSKSRDFGKDFDMPFETGLSMLRDKQDNIDLSLPITGDISNPNFDIKSVINKALNSAFITATKTYLLLALQPFGAILLAGEYALDQLSAVQLQAITFEPGQTKISQPMQQYLGKINTLLDERKGLQIKLCGGANEQDRKALLKSALTAVAETETKTKAQTEAPQKTNARAIEITAQSPTIHPATNIPDTQLLKLAQHRQQAIKRQLIKLGSDPKQIILCQPNILTTDGLPSLKIGI